MFGRQGWVLVVGLCALVLCAGGCQRESESTTANGATDVSPSDDLSTGEATLEKPWPLAWLDESYGERALAWVDRENTATLAALEDDPRFERYWNEAIAVLTDETRLPDARMIGDHVYDYWQEADRPFGVWRRAPADGYFAGEPEWQTVLDLDELSIAESRQWLLAGASCRGQRCLISLSNNGKDAHEVREFDLEARAFVEDGFMLPEDKSSAWWYDDDTLLVATLAGDGEATESELPATIRRWRRGTPLTESELQFEIEDEDAGLSALLIGAAGLDGFVAARRPDFFTSEFFRVDADGERTSLPLPRRMAVKGIAGKRLLIRLNQDWAVDETGETYPSGALIAIALTPLLTEQRIADVELIYAPSPTESVRTVLVTEDGIFVELLRDYRSEIIRLSDDDDEWSVSRLPVAEDRFISLLTVHDGDLVLRIEGLLTPERLELYDWEAESGRTIFERDDAFDREGLVSRLLTTTSRDGTPISYSIVHREDIETNASNPTLVYGYGGFDVSITPRYEPLFGKLWLEKGGVYVHAYLRGGGENGPDWHQSAMLTNRQQPYDDMIAVIEDLHQREIASPATTGIMGRSNGGLMVASVMMQRPELLSAVVVGGPLIDMLTYHLLPPGATWTAEYGDPRDPAMRDFIAGYSPLQQVDRDTEYPVPLIITSTYDDRVLPGHARRFAESLSKAGHDNFYFEDAQGGHYWELAGGPAPGDWRLRSTARALEFTYLADRLMQ